MDTKAFGLHLEGELLISEIDLSVKRRI
uniref:Uncharacterized protein n=1 Tax=Nomascus leucogenys TaxID=61853 RepID=A0A2I3HRE8_NOMLE